jgi:hypothetical protein
VWPNHCVRNRESVNDCDIKSISTCCTYNKCRCISKLGVCKLASLSEDIISITSACEDELVRCILSVDKVKITYEAGQNKLIDCELVTDNWNLLESTDYEQYCIQLWTMIYTIWYIIKFVLCNTGKRQLTFI